MLIGHFRKKAFSLSFLLSSRVLLFCSFPSSPRHKSQFANGEELAGRAREEEEEGFFLQMRGFSWNDNVQSSFLQRLLWAETVAFFSFPPLVFSAACLGLEWERRESRVPPASSCQIVSEPWLSRRRNPLLAFPKNGFCLAFSPAFSGKIWCASNRAWKGTRLRHTMAE